jgi:hypothetical protein
MAGSKRPRGSILTRYTARVRRWTAVDRDSHAKMGFHAGWGAMRRPTHRPINEIRCRAERSKSTQLVRRAYEPDAIGPKEEATFAKEDADGLLEGFLADAERGADFLR